MEKILFGGVKKNFTPPPQKKGPLPMYASNDGRRNQYCFVCVNFYCLSYKLLSQRTKAYAEKHLFKVSVNFSLVMKINYVLTQNLKRQFDRFLCTLQADAFLLLTLIK